MQKSYQSNEPKTVRTMNEISTTNRTPACNIGFARERAKCFDWTFVQDSTFVLRLNFSANNPLPRKAVNRYVQCYQTTADKRPQNDLTITQPLEQFFSCADNPIFPLPIKPRSAFGCNQLIHTEP